jgi:ATP-dependent Lon protease
MTTALVSALSGRLVRRDIAMTGEITLRGKVLKIGGLKEKVVAAHRHKIPIIIIPRDNEDDLEDISAAVRKDLQFRLVGEIGEVLELALLPIGESKVRPAKIGGKAPESDGRKSRRKPVPADHAVPRV